MNVAPVNRDRCYDEVTVRVCNNAKFLGGDLVTISNEQQQVQIGSANLCIVPEKLVLVADFYHQKDPFMFNFEMKDLCMLNVLVLGLRR